MFHNHVFVTPNHDDVLGPIPSIHGKFPFNRLVFEATICELFVYE